MVACCIRIRLFPSSISLLVSVNQCSWIQLTGIVFLLPFKKDLTPMDGPNAKTRFVSSILVQPRKRFSMYCWMIFLNQMPIAKLCAIPLWRRSHIHDLAGSLLYFEEMCFRVRRESIFVAIMRKCLPRLGFATK